ncbi:MAG TPA: hypothetical protein VFA82_09715 [Gaiellaceae bacterium]|nr:hypothetical protein [Gaiellaceae bacterium]
MLDHDDDHEDADHEDDDLPAPTAWDIGVAIALRAEPADRSALDELADAMLVWAEGPEVEALTTRSVAALWSSELEGLLRDGLARAAGLGDGWAPAVSAAAAEFERDPLASPVTRAVVQHLAWELGSGDGPPFFCLCCLDEAVAAAPPEERRRRAREAALLAVHNAAVPPAEVGEAFAARSPARLATDQRRRAVRARLGRLARYGRTSMPALSRELERIAAEPLPADPNDDDVWEVVAHALLAEHARPELN